MAPQNPQLGVSLDELTMGVSLDELTTGVSTKPPYQPGFWESALDWLTNDFMRRYTPIPPSAPGAERSLGEKVADFVIPAAIETVPQIGGAIGGGLLAGPGGVAAGSAVGGGAGNLASQQYRKYRGLQDQISVPEALVSTGISAVPGSWFGKKAATPVGNVIFRGGQNYATSVGGRLLTEHLEGDEFDLGTALLAGIPNAVFGGIGGKIEASVPGARRFETARNAAIREAEERAAAGRVTPPTPEPVSRAEFFGTTEAAVGGKATGPRAEVGASPAPVVTQTVDVSELAPRTGRVVTPPATGVTPPTIEPPTEVTPPTEAPPKVTSPTEPTPDTGYIRGPKTAPDVTDLDIEFVNQQLREATTREETQALHQAAKDAGLEIAGVGLATKPATPLTSKAVPAATPPTPTVSEAPTRTGRPYTPLPKELAGAKPRYRDKTPIFENDIDKAGFIITQTTKSKADAAYLQYFLDQTGVTEAEARAYGRTVRERMKPLYAEATGDTFNVPSGKAPRPAVTALRPPPVPEAPTPTVPPVPEAPTPKPVTMPSDPDTVLRSGLYEQFGHSAVWGDVFDRVKADAEKYSPKNPVAYIQAWLDRNAAERARLKGLALTQPIVPDYSRISAADLKASIKARSAAGTSPESLAGRAEPFLDYKMLTDAPVPKTFAELPAIEQRQVRRLLRELDEFQYEQGKHIPMSLNAGDMKMIPRQANALVYRLLTETTKRTGPQIRKSVESWINGGRTSAIHRDVARVARMRAYVGELGNREGKGTLPPTAIDRPGEVWPTLKDDRDLVEWGTANAPGQLATINKYAPIADQVLDAYEAKNGQLWNGDNMSLMLNPHEQGKDWARKDHVRPMATLLVDEGIKRALSREPDPDRLAVLFTAGGVGSGKSRSIATKPGTEDVDWDAMPGTGMIVDSTLRSYERAREQLRQVLQSGRGGRIEFTYRDPVDAFKGVIDRFKQVGRPETIDTLIKTHREAPETFARLMDAARMNPDDPLQFFMFENVRPGESPELRHTADGAPDLEWLRAKQAQYNDPDALRARLEAVLADEVAAWRRNPSTGLSPDAARRLGATGDFTSGTARPLEADLPRTDVVRPGLADTPEQTVIPPPAEGGGAPPVEPPVLPPGGGGEPPVPPGGGEPPLPPGGGEGPPGGPAGEGRYGPPGEPPPPKPPKGTRGIPAQEKLTQERIDGEEKFISKLPEYLQEPTRQMLRGMDHYETQRRGVQPSARTSKLADHIAVEHKKLVPPGTAMNAEQLEAGVNAYVASMNEMRALAKKEMTGTATAQDRAAFVKAVTESSILLGNFMGARAETGRALNNLKKIARSMRAVALGADEGPALDALLREAKRAGIDPAKLAPEFLGITDPIEQMKWLRKTLMTPSASDWIKSYWYTGLLSRPATHLRNLLGNSTNAVFKSASHPAAIAWDVVRSKYQGRKLDAKEQQLLARSADLKARKQAGEDVRVERQQLATEMRALNKQWDKAGRSMFLGETKYGIQGAAVGFWEGMKNAKFAAQHGFTRSDLGTFDLPRKEIQSLDPWGKIKLEGGKNPLNWMSRALEAEDEFFYGVNYYTELYARLYAHARQTNVPKDLIHDRVTTWALNPPPQIEEAARKAALHSVYKEEGGKLSKWLQKGKKDLPWLDFVIPFVKTPANLMRQGIEATPLGVALPSWRRTFKEGGREQSEQMGRMITGTAGLGALGSIAWMFGTGMLTGTGTKDPEERAARLREGWKPNSVNIGKTYIPFTDLAQPLSQPLFVMANAFDKFHAGEPFDPKRISLTFASSLLDQSFLTGLSDMTRAISDEERFGQQFFDRYVQNVVPYAGLVRTGALATDPVVRESDREDFVGSTLDSLKSVIPGLSTTVAPKVGTLGEAVTRQGGWVQRAISPVSPGWMPDDPIVQELARLGIQNIAVPPKDLRETERYPAIRLTVAERQQLGQATKNALRQLFANPKWRTVDPRQAPEYIKDVIRQAREQATEQIRRAHASADRR